METKNKFIASVIVPAHNESAVIGRLLDVLSPGILSNRFDVVVACNGCSDDTAQIARKYGARVIEVDVPSKIAALNAGDEVALAFPRIYIDADVGISAAALIDLANVLSEGNMLCAAPPFTVDLSESSLLVRAYYAIWIREPQFKDAYVGSGIYGISEAGRARFGRFPDVIADDWFVHNMYKRSERCVVTTSPFTIQAPRTLRSLFRRRVRISRGNMELAAHPEYGRLTKEAKRSRPWWTVVVSNPLLGPCAFVYVAVNAIAKFIALKQIYSKQRVDWARDETIRT